MAKLIVISSDERQEFELGNFNSIGRHPDNTIQILDRIISKEHATLQRLPDGSYLLRDLQSLNGTFVRGDRVTERRMEDGDEISMGSTRLLFVNRASENLALNRVTIAPGLTESHIRQRIAASTGEFLPERLKRLPERLPGALLELRRREGIRHCEAATAGRRGHVPRVHDPQPSVP